MINLRRSGILIASAVAFAFSAAIGTSPASAAAVSIASPLKALSDSNVGVQEVQSRRQFRGQRSGNRRGMSRRGMSRRSFRGGRSYSGRSFRGSRSYRGRGYRSSRGYRYRGYRSRRSNILPYIGLGIAGAVLHHGLSSGAYGSSAMNRCAQRFRSFEWDTGYYTTYGGQRRLCPYLR